MAKERGIRRVAAVGRIERFLGLRQSLRQALLAGRGRVAPVLRLAEELAVHVAVHPHRVERGGGPLQEVDRLRHRTHAIERGRVLRERVELGSDVVPGGQQGPCERTTRCVLAYGSAAPKVRTEVVASRVVVLEGRAVLGIPGPEDVPSSPLGCDAHQSVGSERGRKGRLASGTRGEDLGLSPAALQTDPRGWSREDLDPGPPVRIEASRARRSSPSSGPSSDRGDGARPCLPRARGPACRRGRTGSGRSCRRSASASTGRRAPSARRASGLACRARRRSSPVRMRPPIRRRRRRAASPRDRR